MKFRVIPLASIQPDPDQPRRDWSSPDAVHALEELAAAIIESKGLLQPILVRQDADNGYIIIDGERRYRAAKKAGLAELPCYIRDDLAGGDRQAAQLFANLARRGLSSDEIADSIVGLRASGYRAVELAERLGRSAGWVSKQIAYATEPEALDLRNKGILNSASTYADFKILPPAAKEEVIRLHTEAQSPINKASMASIAKIFGDLGISEALQHVSDDAGEVITPKRAEQNKSATAPVVVQVSWQDLERLHRAFPSELAQLRVELPGHIADSLKG